MADQLFDDHIKAMFQAISNFEIPDIDSNAVKAIQKVPQVESYSLVILEILQTIQGQFEALSDNYNKYYMPQASASEEGFLNNLMNRLTANGIKNCNNNERDKSKAVITALTTLYLFDYLDKADASVLQSWLNILSSNDEVLSTSVISDQNALMIFLNATLRTRLDIPADKSLKMFFTIMESADNLCKERYLLPFVAYEISLIHLKQQCYEESAIWALKAYNCTKNIKPYILFKLQNIVSKFPQAINHEYLAQITK